MTLLQREGKRSSEKKPKKDKKDEKKEDKKRGASNTADLGKKPDTVANNTDNKDGRSEVKVETKSPENERRRGTDAGTIEMFKYTGEIPPPVRLFDLILEYTHVVEAPS